MPLDQIKRIGQGTRFGLEDRDSGATLWPEVKPGAVMVALAEAGIDEAEIAGCIEHIAEGGERRGRKGACVQDHGLRPGQAAGARGFTPLALPVGYLGTDEGVIAAPRMHRGRAIGRGD